MISNDPLFGEKQPKKSPLLIAILIFIICTLIISVVAMIFAIKASNVQIIQQVINNTALPVRFSVDKNYILPPTDQMNIGTCWSFAMIYLLESQYHAQGVEQGLLEENEYVQFSKQAFFTWLHDQCMKHPDVKACHYGGLMHNTSADQQIESIYYFAKAWEETKTSVLPESVCPYRSIPEGEEETFDYFYCPNLYKALEKNPIKWEYVSSETAYTLNDVKRLLIKANRALGIGVPLPNLVYYLPCNGSIFAETDMCVNKSILCPDAVGQYCYKLELDARQQDGIFLSNVDPKYMGELGGHAMNVVAYNDEWLYRNRYQTENNAIMTKGGLILHNSWRQTGHSVEYLMGQRSEENEAIVCPNHVCPLNWIPATLECIKNNTVNGVFDYTKCSSDTKRVRGKGHTKGADILTCKSSAIAKGICTNTSKYVLLKKTESDSNPDVEALPGGVNNIKIAEITNTNEVKEMAINDMPFWALSQIFQPNPETLVQNDDFDCGYWMLPYQTLENMQKINWDFFDNFRVFDYHVTFAPQSYMKHADSKPFDHTYMENSTKKITKVEFDGPLPYQYVF
ncbi:papain family cysteine protease domain containing protein [Histomonas meleagridis]|uniref:papain family cysteine protease domain containing protein n=1 Tax=Histomonas meleagridis TaxID=135588 RepID=UPI003559A32D|nr:papain family cysteine protease domain containing protein [Histomonas meleagridis]KAH0804413.1 papain family cysteine protease domain containing protein [Histomonas meleagridis]